MNKKLLVTALASMVFLTGCASSQQSAHTYSRDEVQQVQAVLTGTALSVNAVIIEGSNSGVGIGTGALIGAVIGSQVGGGTGAKVGAALGGIGGGVAGSHAEKGLTKKQGEEITIRLDHNGQVVSIVQEVVDGVFVKPGPVRILTRGQTIRVMN